MTTKEIYIYLLDEGTDVWRPTLGEELKENVFRILPTSNYDPDIEHWEFLPGQVVRCVTRVLSGGKRLVAEEKLDEIDQ